MLVPHRDVYMTLTRPVVILVHYLVREVLTAVGSRIGHSTATGKHSRWRGTIEPIPLNIYIHNILALSLLTTLNPRVTSLPRQVFQTILVQRKEGRGEKTFW